MATGVKPRDDDHQLTRSDLDTIQDAMKSPKFRDLLKDYCVEVSDPANQALYQKEMTQLEKERGYDITFLNPKGGYVIKTSVAGDRKAFINICSNDNVGKPSYKVQVVDGKRGMNWQIPYSIVPPREDYNSAKKERIIIYDVVFHPDTLRMAEVNKQFRELVNKSAFEGLQKQYNIHLDSNNCRFPKIKAQYKGMTVPSVIRTEDPHYVPPNDEDTEEISPEVLEKLYPQHTYSPKDTTEPASNVEPPKQAYKKNAWVDRELFKHASSNGYTIPKYIIKQQKNVDLQEFTYNKNCKEHSAIPSHVVVEIYLPLLSSTKDCTLDVQEKSLSLISEKPAKYKLDINLPYSVNDECGNAKFEKIKRILIVTLTVIKKYSTSDNKNSLKGDSGVESEENSASQSEDENFRENLVVEISSAPVETAQLLTAQEQITSTNMDSFLDKSLGYMLPPYTHNILDDVIAFTFHVKNTEPDSVQVKTDHNRIFIKFSSVGAGYVPVNYAAVIIFDELIKFENVSGEAWDNNVILQLELTGEIPQKFAIGLNTDSTTSEYIEIPQIKKASKLETTVTVSKSEDLPAPVVEVTNLGTETNIVVSSNIAEYDEDDIESPRFQDEEMIWIDPSSCENGAKSILRKPMSMMRSFSESSVGDVASSMDYISSDCIPEESSLKKTVRFNDVIAKQFYRYNSSIEGQKKKNQRKKSKKRNQDRRKSESEAEDDFTDLSNENGKPRLKSALKQRRDSGLADTSDAEADGKNTPSEYNSSYDSTKDCQDYLTGNNDDFSTEESDSVLNIVGNDNKKDETKSLIWKSESSATPDKNTEDFHENKDNVEAVTCSNIKHNTNFYNPDKLNKGQYLEVSFKNDLIFDLDM